MSALRVLVIMGIAGGGAFHFWKQHEAAVAVAAVVASADENGFVDLPPAEGQNSDTVYVVAAQNCPHDDAQRADRLAEDLSGKGIPVVRTHDVMFRSNGMDRSAVNRLNVIMNGPLPIVFIRGKARSNASLDQIVAEAKLRGISSPD